MDRQPYSKNPFSMKYDTAKKVFHVLSTFDSGCHQIVSFDHFRNYATARAFASPDVLQLYLAAIWAANGLSVST